MDTQGTFDSTTISKCSNIFGLSTLLSTHQCYNLSENITEESLLALKLFIEYGQLVLNEQQDFGKPFQVLLIY